jgi:hypothetical protein
MRMFFPDYRTNAGRVVNFIFISFKMIPKSLHAEEFRTCFCAYTENNEFY